MDELGENMDDLDMIDLSLLVTAGGRTICMPRTWKGNQQWCQHAQIFIQSKGRVGASSTVSGRFFDRVDFISFPLVEE